MSASRSGQCLAWIVELPLCGRSVGVRRRMHSPCSPATSPNAAAVPRLCAPAPRLMSDQYFSRHEIGIAACRARPVSRMNRQRASEHRMLDAFALAGDYHCRPSPAPPCANTGRHQGIPVRRRFHYECAGAPLLHRPAGTGPRARVRLLLRRVLAPGFQRLTFGISWICGGPGFSDARTREADVRF